jgi:hypothetical protein
MPPTDALFDAINRGDIAAAKDALSRGADLNGHNILGMTPLELSVDLSRNDITFLLLSMQDAARPVTSPTQAGAAASHGAPAKPAAPAKLAAERPKAVRVSATQPRPHTPPASGEERAYAVTDPGTPNPQVGFLGFGGAVR